MKGCDMDGLLKTQFTLVTDEGCYITKYGDSYLLGDNQCPYLTFDDSVGECWDIWYELSNSDEFDWTTIHVIQIDKHVINY